MNIIIITVVVLICWACAYMFIMISRETEREGSEPMSLVFYILGVLIFLAPLVIGYVLYGK